MQRLEVSGAVRPIYGSLGVKRLTSPVFNLGPSGVHSAEFIKILTIFCSHKANWIPKNIRYYHHKRMKLVVRWFQHARSQQCCPLLPINEAGD